MRSFTFIGTKFNEKIIARYLSNCFQFCVCFVLISGNGEHGEMIIFTVDASSRLFRSFVLLKLGYMALSYENSWWNDTNRIKYRHSQWMPELKFIQTQFRCRSRISISDGEFPFISFFSPQNNRTKESKFKRRKKPEFPLETIRRFLGSALDWTINLTTFSTSIYVDGIA